MKYLKFILAMMLTLALYASESLAVAMDGTVRVCLSSLENPGTLHLQISGSYSIGEENGLALANGLSAVVQASGSQLSFSVSGRVQKEGKTLTLRRHLTSGKNGLYIQEAQVPSNLYPCDLEMTAVDGGIRVIAYIYMEDYLLGVLPYEMNNSFPLEALKAQAVSARSYALRKMSLNSRLYDVVDTTADQVYCGTPEVQDRCFQAVTETWGMVGMVNGQLMPGYYTASNGGQTESVKNAWGGGDYEFLYVMDDPYDLKNPESEVRSAAFYKNGKTGSDSLTALLQKAANSAAGTQNERIQKIMSVEAAEPRYAEPSRVYSKIHVKLQMESGKEETVVLDYSEVEKAANLSINTLNNEVLSVEESTDRFTLYARRMGHGVGLSQRGAQQMANDGLGMEDILRFYYPGIEIQKYNLAQRMLFALNGTKSSGSAVYDSKVKIAASDNMLDFIPLRSTPDSNGKILKILSGGTQVILLQQGAPWSMIQNGLTVGYIETACLQDPQKEPETEEPVMTVKLEDITQSLNIRSAPTAYSQIVGSLRNGEKVSLVSQYTNWSCIRFGSLIGYVRSEYITQYTEASPSGLADSTAGSVLPGMQALVLPASGTDLYADSTAASFVYFHLPQGTQLKVTGLEINGMLPVSLGGLAGYVLTDMLYISIEETESSAEQDSRTTDETAEVTAASGLKLRNEASTSGAVLLTMPYLASVRVLQHTNEEFWNVDYNGTIGYAAAKYLSLKNAAEETAVPTAEPTASPTSAPTAEPTSVPAASQILTTGYALVSAKNGVNLRNTPSENGSVITVLGYGVRVQITGSQTNGYYPVCIGSLSGYVSGGYLSMEESDSQESASAEKSEWAGKQAMVTSKNGLNLRAEANASSASYYILPYGTVVQVEKEADDHFLLVSWSGYRGYVSKDYMSLLEQN